MRCVGDEVALRVERGLEPGEEAVDRVCEVFHFVVWAGEREPLMQVAFADLLGLVCHRAQRCEHPAGDDPAERDREHSHDCERDRGLDQQLLEIMGVLCPGLGAELRRKP